MKYILSIMLIIFVAACEQAPKADKATITEAHPVKESEGSPYKVDTVNSEIQWIGTKPTGKHIGLFKVQEGKLLVKDKVITGGNIIIKMNSLENIDLSKTDTILKRKLENELKGPLFFDVTKFPVATFEITSVSDFSPSVGNEVLMKNANYTVQGNLTIKNITKNISFPAIIKFENGVITALANFNIDRTLWGMTYRADKSMQDKLINSAVNIEFRLKAMK
ncbi:YceI family protein [Chitinophaga sp. CF418]|uniref:YceI family protein n=1 Tax=Chitinophaga sp. CF418 TaxID=1855287 RepID=UPI000914B671|nr:YceI family protein [Chitinophaga sp. CF418]SHN44985.1 Polyisoprenoid-binding protein YceI [Chitinophaga sp. CF418]